MLLAPDYTNPENNRILQPSFLVTGKHRRALGRQQEQRPPLRRVQAKQSDGEGMSLWSDILSVSAQTSNATQSHDQTTRVPLPDAA